MDKPLPRREKHPPPRPAAPEPALAELAAFMRAHCDEALTLGALAAMAGLSVSRFTTVFRATFGKPPHRFLTETRIDRAKTLLAAGSTIAGAASAAGFYDQSHLSRHFKRAVGVTPHQFRGHAQGAGDSRAPWRMPASLHRPCNPQQTLPQPQREPPCRCATSRS